MDRKDLSLLLEEWRNWRGTQELKLEVEIFHGGMLHLSLESFGPIEILE